MCILATCMSTFHILLNLFFATEKGVSSLKGGIKKKVEGSFQIKLLDWQCSRMTEISSVKCISICAKLQSESISVSLSIGSILLEIQKVTRGLAAPKDISVDAAVETFSH